MLCGLVRKAKPRARRGKKAIYPCFPKQPHIRIFYKSAQYSKVFVCEKKIILVCDQNAYISVIFLFPYTDIQSRSKPSTAASVRG